MTDEQQQVGEPCPEDFWLGEPTHCTGRVLLVVNLEARAKRVDERLSWLEKNVFPRSVFPKRTLIVYSGWSLLPDKFQELKEPGPWDHFEDWQDLYTKFLLGGFFPTVENYKSFHFALVLNVREDRLPGFGYVREECRDERCILRAVFLASRGNVLFGNWGFPDMCHPRVTAEILRKTCFLPAYMYSNVQFRRFPNANGARAGPAFLPFIPHYLRSDFAEAKGLPLITMEMVRKGVHGSLFDAYERRKAYWNAYWLLYFAADGVWVVYHKWQLARGLQLSLIWNHIVVRIWLGSSYSYELMLDILVLFCAGMAPFCLLDHLIWHEDPLFASAKYVMWWIFWHLVCIPDEEALFDRQSYRELATFSANMFRVIVLLEVMRKAWWIHVQMLTPTEQGTLAMLIVSTASMDMLSDVIVLDNPGQRNRLSVALLLSLAVCVANAEVRPLVLTIIIGQGIIAGLFAQIRWRFGRRDQMKFGWENVRSWIIAPCLVAAVSLSLESLSAMLR